MGLSINRINLNSTPANGEIAPRRREGKTLNPLRTFTALIPNSSAHSESFLIKKSISIESPTWSRPSKGLLLISTSGWVNFDDESRRCTPPRNVVKWIRAYTQKYGNNLINIGSLLHECSANMWFRRQLSCQIARVKALFGGTSPEKGWKAVVVN